MDQAQAAAAAAASEMEAARASDRETREREALARAELFRADEALTALQGRVNALEQLERDRVGLAPAASRLLKERERFGEGAVLGPVSDFIAADQASALLVEKFLGNTVHAVLVRDRAAADAIRAWHEQANPGPLLLLPLDAMSDEASGEQRAGRVVASRVDGGRRPRVGAHAARARARARRRQRVRRRARRGVAARHHGGPRSAAPSRRAGAAAHRADVAGGSAAGSVAHGGRDARVAGRQRAPRRGGDRGSRGSTAGRARRRRAADRVRRDASRAPRGKRRKPPRSSSG